MDGGGGDREKEEGEKAMLHPEGHATRFLGTNANAYIFDEGVEPKHDLQSKLTTKAGMKIAFIPAKMNDFSRADMFASLCVATRQCLSQRVGIKQGQDRKRM